MYLNYDEKYSDFKNKTIFCFKNFIANNRYFDISVLEKSIANDILIINNRRNLKSNVL
jgi:hypothetical protein